MPLNAFQRNQNFNRNTFAITYPPLLDVLPTAHTAYGFSKLRAAYAGSCCRVRTSGGTETDIGFDASGNIDAAALATAAGSGTLYVKIWYDQSGNGKNLDITTFNTANAPQIVQSGTIVRDVYGNIGMRYTGTNAGMSENNFLYHATAFPAGDNTVVAHFEPKLGTLYSYGAIYKTTNHGLEYGAFGNIDNMLYKNGGGAMGSRVTSYAGKPEFIISTSDFTALKSTVWQNGIQGGPPATMTTFTPATDFWVGFERGAFRYNCQGILTQLVIYNRVFTRTEIRNAWLIGKQVKRMPNPYYLICDGDSLSLGSGTGRNYQYQLQSMISSNSLYVYYNVGVGGTRWTTGTDNFNDRAATAVTGIDNLQYVEPKPNRMLITWGGFNDYANGQSGATTYANALTYFTNRVAAGVAERYGIFCSHLAGDSGQVGRAVDFNNLVRPSVASGALKALGVTTLFDPWTIPQMDTDGEQSNATYWFDTVHFTIAGQQLIASMVKQTLNLS